VVAKIRVIRGLNGSKKLSKKSKKSLPPPEAFH
jgi:hypothetical protein